MCEGKSDSKSFDLSVYVIIDPEICGDDKLEFVALAALRGGATFLQLRNKKDTQLVVEKQARRIMEVVEGFDAVFVLDDYVELATRLGADGVHVGQDDMNYRRARAIIGEDKILGLTAFTRAHYDDIDPGIVDYVGTGPVFSTLTKPDKKVLGVGGFADLVKHACVPVVGIGGISPDNAGEVIKAGAHGVAMIRSVVGALDVQGAARAFVDAVKGARA